jgi:hypothetical protein
VRARDDRAHRAVRHLRCHRYVAMREAKPSGADDRLLVLALGLAPMPCALHPPQKLRPQLARTLPRPIRSASAIEANDTPAAIARLAASPHPPLQLRVVLKITTARRPQSLSRGRRTASSSPESSTSVFERNAIHLASATTVHSTMMTRPPDGHDPAPPRCAVAIHSRHTARFRHMDRPIPHADPARRYSLPPTVPAVSRDQTEPDSRPRHSPSLDSAAPVEGRSNDSGRSAVPRRPVPTSLPLRDAEARATRRPRDGAASVPTRKRRRRGGRFPDCPANAMPRPRPPRFLVAVRAGSQHRDRERRCSMGGSAASGSANRADGFSGGRRPRRRVEEGRRSACGARSRGGRTRDS